MMSAMDLQNNYYMSEEGKRFWACSKRGSKQEQQDAGGDEDEDEDEGEGAARVATAPHSRPQPVPTKGARRATSKKPEALRATPAGADDRLALRQWLFHPLLTQARLRHPTFCP